MTARRPAPVSGLVRDALRRPATWLVLPALAGGAFATVRLLAPPFAAYPLATVVAIVVFALYAVPFLAYIHRVDYFEREPVGLLGFAFGWGALVAMPAAVAGNTAGTDILAKLVSPRFAQHWGAALVGPVVEEPLKLLGVVVIAVVVADQVNSVLDGFVYGAVVGLGFQVAEDVLYAVNAVDTAGVGDRVGPVFTTLLVRGFVGGLWSHTLFTALAGAGVGYAVVREQRSRALRVGYLGACLAAAWACHTLWNAPMLSAGLRAGPLAALAELLLKGVPTLMVVLAMAKAAGSQEADYYARILDEVADPQVATPAEITALASPALRADARRVAWRVAGWRGAVAVYRLHRAQARLAVQLSRDGAGSVEATRAGYVAVFAARQRLTGYGLTGAAPPPALPGNRRIWPHVAIGVGVVVFAVGLGLLLRALTE